MRTLPEKPDVFDIAIAAQRGEPPPTETRHEAPSFTHHAEAPPPAPPAPPARRARRPKPDGKALPYAEAEERALLGAMLQSADAIAAALEALPGGASEFASPTGQRVYAALLNVHARAPGQNIDGLGVIAELAKIDGDRDGAARTLADLLAAVPSHLRAKDYAAAVHAAHLRRGYVRRFDELSALAQNGATPAELAAESRMLLEPLHGASENAGAPIGATSRLAARVLADVAIERTDWLWYGRIAAGTVTVISSAPGDGKSTIMADVMARVTTGARWPFSEARAPQGRVIAVNVEEDVSRTVRPRFEAANGDLSLYTVIDRVFDADGTPRLFDIGRDLTAVERMIREYGDVRLVQFDPLGPLMGETETNHNSRTYAMLAPLATLAHDYGVAVVAVTHTRKLKEGSAIDRLMGSRAFTALPRNVHCIIPEDAGDATDEKRPDEVRLFAHAKASLSRKSPALRFQIQETADRVPYVNWLGEVDATADDLLRSQEKSAADSGRGGREKQIDRALDWVRDTLAAGPMPAKELAAAADAAGIAPGTLRKAKERLNVAVTPQRDDTGQRLAGFVCSLPLPDSA